MKEKSSKTTFLLTIFSLILILLNYGCSEKNVIEDEEQIPIENSELIEKPEEK